VSLLTTGQARRSDRIIPNPSTFCSPIIATLIIALPGFVLRNWKAVSRLSGGGFFVFIRSA